MVTNYQDKHYAILAQYVNQFARKMRQGFKNIMMMIVI